MLVWVTNGLICKVLNLVPRHQEIVERILGMENGRFITVLIGLGETLMAIWILSGFRTRLCAIVQIGLVLAMNVLEFSLAPDLLLWGKLNLVFAILFCALIYYWEFELRKKVN